MKMRLNNIVITLLVLGMPQEVSANVIQDATNALITAFVVGKKGTQEFKELSKAAVDTAGALNDQYSMFVDTSNRGAETFSGTVEGGLQGLEGGGSGTGISGSSGGRVGGIFGKLNEFTGQKLQQLETGLGDAGERIGQKIGQGAGTGVSMALEDDLDRIEGVADRALETGARVTTQGMATGLAFGAMADQRVESTVNTADARLERMGEQAVEAAGNVELEGVNKALDGVAAATGGVAVAAGTVHKSADEVPRVLEAGFDNLGTELRATTATLDRSLYDVKTSIDESGNQIVNVVDKQGRSLTRTVDAQGNQLFLEGGRVVYAINSQGNDITAAINSASDTLSDDIGDAAGGISDSIDNGFDVAGEDLDARFSRMQTRIASLPSEVEVAAAKKLIVVLPNIDSIERNLALFEEGAPLRRFWSDTSTFLNTPLFEKYESAAEQARRTVATEPVMLPIQKAIMSFQDVQYGEMSKEQFEQYKLALKNLEIRKFKVSGKLRTTVLRLLQEFDKGLFNTFLIEEELAYIDQLKQAFADALHENTITHLENMSKQEIDALVAHFQAQSDAIVADATQRHTQAFDDRVAAVDAQLDQAVAQDQGAAVTTEPVASLSELGRQAGDTRQEKVDAANKEYDDLLDVKIKLVQAIRDGAQDGVEVKIRRILITADGAGSDAAAQAFANNVHTEVTRNPQIFGQKAGEVSHDPDSKVVQGLIDYFSRGQKTAGLEAIAFGLTTPNQISPVTKTLSGYEIVQLVHRRVNSDSAAIDNDVRAFNDRIDANIEAFDSLGITDKADAARKLKSEVQTALDAKAPERSNTGVGGIY